MSADASPRPDGALVRLSRDEQRSLGAYYTPADIAETLTAWALRGNAGPVLDPSYGICRFLDAAVDVLARMRAPHPERQVHGIDIDREGTAETTAALMRRGAHQDQFVHRDFFACPADPSYAAVLGNPPYVRHHWQNEKLKASAAAALGDAAVPLSRRASLWAPFVVHADRFVRDGGRLAMLLPGAAIQAQYARPVSDHLAARYRTVTLVRVGERAFADALEETVVLLAYERGDIAAAEQPLVAQLKTFSDLADALESDVKLAQLRKTAHPSDSARRTLTARRLLKTAMEHEATCLLGDVATVRIGTVTGANWLFLRTGDDPLLDELDDDEIVPVVPRSGALVGARWTRPDDRHVVAAGERARLLRLDPERRSRGFLKEVLDAARSTGIDQRSHCRRRDPWWAIPPRPAPQAFLPYMAGTPKGLVLNVARAECINGVHRVDWIAGDARRYLVSTWTSLWALAIEERARHYAGGVLKLEPGSAPRLPVVPISESKAVATLDRELRRGGVAAARDFADRLVLEETLGFSPAQLAALREATASLAARRSPRFPASTRCS